MGLLKQYGATSEINSELLWHDPLASTKADKLQPPSLPNREELGHRQEM